MHEDMKKQYNLRFRHFIHEITVVSHMNPREKFLYRIMDGVPFKDLETAIMMVKSDFDKQAEKAGNDNGKK